MTPETKAFLNTLEAVRSRVMELLQREGRALHSGDIAARLGVATHMIHSAMHVPLQRREAWFHSSEGYSLPPVINTDSSDDSQTGIDLA